MSMKASNEMHLAACHLQIRCLLRLLLLGVMMANCLGICITLNSIINSSVSISKGLEHLVDRAVVKNICLIYTYSS